jgi:hypothetical protein
MPPHASKFAETKDCARIVAHNAGDTLSSKLGARSESLNHPFEDLCAPHVVSPRDLWLCVLPRWQINVNVNV